MAWASFPEASRILKREALDGALRKISLTQDRAAKVSQSHRNAKLHVPCLVQIPAD